jgi:hypothetical protein
VRLRKSVDDPIYALCWYASGRGSMRDWVRFRAGVGAVVVIGLYWAGVENVHSEMFR